MRPTPGPTPAQSCGSGHDPRRADVRHLACRRRPAHPAEALYQRCLDLGTTFVFNTSVEQITTDAAGVTGVRIQDGSTVPPTSWWPMPMPARSTERCCKTAAHVDRCSGLPRCSPPSPVSSSCWPSTADPGIRHHNVWFPADYDAEFDQLFSKNPSPVSDPAIYACVPDDPAMRPDGAESWFILVNAPTQDPPAMDWSARSEDYADHVLAVLAERGVDLRGRIRWRRIRTPENLATAPPPRWQYLRNVQQRPVVHRTAPGQPQPRSRFVLVGGSAHPAAACHWSAWARRSWPPKSAGLEPAVPRSPTVE